MQVHPFMRQQHNFPAYCINLDDMLANKNAAQW